MTEYLLQFSASPLQLVFAIIAFAWLWEDGALIGGALLAADQHLPVSMAMAAIFVGICSGDLALYYIGVLARRWRGLRAKLLKNRKYRSMSRRFRRRTLSNIFIIRFIPGLRTAGFTVCGLWRIPLQRFLIAICLAGVMWIGVLFTLIYFLGTSDGLINSPWKWALAGIALCLFIFNNVFSNYRSRLSEK